MAETKMKRKIIQINEELCDGCGNCVTGCSEGAIEIIDGKAKLVNERFCDGFGDCIGTCPTGALEIVEREVEPFVLEETREWLLKTRGIEAVWRMEEAHRRHEEQAKVKAASFSEGSLPSNNKWELETNAEFIDRPSALEQWPVHLRLVNPMAHFFKRSEMVIMSTCGPLTYNGVHERYLAGRSVVVACPKLDDTRDYIPKLAQIFSQQPVRKVIVVRIEVPCCGGITAITERARSLAGRDDLTIEEHILSIKGEIMNYENFRRKNE